MSVPSSLLDEEGRRDIVAFYSEVFGWQELPTETVDRLRLILSTYSYDQFVFLIADDDPMRAPRMDHFGLGVAGVEDLDAIHDRAVSYARRDERVEVLERRVESYPGLTLTSFYVRYLLPLMVEVQHFGFDPGRS